MVERLVGGERVMETLACLEQCSRTSPVAVLQHSAQTGLSILKIMRLSSSPGKKHDRNLPTKGPKKRDPYQFVRKRGKLLVRCVPYHCQIGEYMFAPKVDGR